MRHIVALLVLITLLGHSGTVGAQATSPESGGEQAAYKVASVLGTLLYTPLKATLCFMGGAASTFVYVSSGAKAMRTVARTSCKGTWVLTPDHLKGDAPLNVLDDSLTPRDF